MATQYAIFRTIHEMLLNTENYYPISLANNYIHLFTITTDLTSSYPKSLKT